jgi:hypothetical protein
LQTAVSLTSACADALQHCSPNPTQQFAAAACNALLGPICSELDSAFADALQHCNCTPQSLTKQLAADARNALLCPTCSELDVCLWPQRTALHLLPKQPAAAA